MSDTEFASHVTDADLLVGQKSSLKSFGSEPPASLRELAGQIAPSEQPTGKIARRLTTLNELADTLMTAIAHLGERIDGVLGPPVTLPGAAAKEIATPKHSGLTTDLDRLISRLGDQVNSVNALADRVEL